MPTFWGFAAFALFGLPQGRAADTFWFLNHLCCPFYSLPTLFELPLTAVLYAFLTWLVTSVLDRLRFFKKT